MPDAEPQNQRLPRSFHNTFVPERQYINAMVSYAASGQSGDMHEISEATGIPTGKSSGKVIPILDYCRAMGLVSLTGPRRTATKETEVTAFGRTVLLEDPYLKEPLTQWLAHLNLCGSLTGADVWYQTFFAGTQALGMCFSREKLDEHLALVYGVNARGLIGPLVRTYEDDAALGTCGALSEDAGTISRHSAPLADEYGRAYAAWILQLMDDHFPGVGQVAVTELDARAGWRTIPGWGIGEIQSALSLVERKGAIAVDRHMDPWLLRAMMPSGEAWKQIYDDLM